MFYSELYSINAVYKWLSVLSLKRVAVCLTLKFIIFAFCLFLQAEIFFFLSSVFSQQEYYFKQIALFICSASRIGIIMVGPLMGELLEVRKVSA